MEIGSHCNYADCNRLDFLPIECSHCKIKYCLDHSYPESHSCPDFSSLNEEKKSVKIERIECKFIDCNSGGVRIKCDLW